MKQQIKKWTFRLLVTAFVIAGILIVIILNPVLTYANQTTHSNLTIYHKQAVTPSLLGALNQAAEMLKTSEFYNPKLKLDLCLNDGAWYPNLMQAIRGPAFAWGFYDKVVLQGTANYKDNYVALNGYKWNLTQLLAHEMTHCLQFDKLGLWKSNPIANIPDWKWEGYAEYIARQNNDQKDLAKNIERLLTSDKESWAITFSDGTIAPRAYYNYWILVQYCLAIKQMRYEQVLADTTTEEGILKEMMRWYEQEKKQAHNSRLAIAKLTAVVSTFYFYRSLPQMGR